MKKRVTTKVKRLPPVKTRAADNATWDTGTESIRVRDMEDAHLINTTHYVEKMLVKFDRIYGDLLKESRYRRLLLR